MAGYQSAEAYDFAMFEPRGSAARAAQPAAEPAQKKKPARNPNLRVVPAKQADAAPPQAKVSGFKIASIILCCCFLFAFIGLFINNSVRSTELMNAINDMEVNINNAKSENVRLSSEIDSMFSIGKVEAYATDVLGMSKMENYQIRYVDLSADDQVLYAGENSAPGAGFVERVTEYFNGLFA